MKHFNIVPQRAGPRGMLAFVAASAILSAVALAAGSGTALAQCQYEVTAILDIGDCDIGDSHTFGQGMNNSADVVGYYRFCAVGNERAFFWSEDTGFITLPHPDGVVRSWAYDISDNRIIVGQHEFTGIGRKGFAYDMATGEYKHLEPLHEGATATNVSSANAINNNGVVAGMRIIGKSGNTPHNAVIWRPFEKGSPVEDLGVLNGPNSNLRDIDEETNEVVGWTGQSTTTTANAIVQEGNTLTILDVVPGTHTSQASSRNKYLLVTGSGANTQLFIARGFVWTGEFEVIEPPPGFNSSSAGAINDVGQALVLMATGAALNRPFLWQHGEATDLNELIMSGPLLTRPRDINNHGQILVRAGTKGVLLSPINVPLGDLNFDCNVDAHDLQILLNQWGAVPRSATGAQGPNGVPSADLNGDGVVDGADLLILLASWNP